MKDRIRKHIINKLKIQPKNERRRLSNLIRKRLSSLKEYKKAKVIMFYLAKHYEVDTIGMIREALRLGKKVCVPVTIVGKHRLVPSEIADLKNELEIGPFGISHPKAEYIRKVPINKIDLVIVPGIAFNEAGDRIGHGKGFYDRFLARLSKDIPKVGLAFKFQIVKEIPRHPHDISVTHLVSA